MGGENVSPSRSERKAEVWETLVVQEWLEFAGVPFLLAFREAQSPWTLRGM